MPRVRFIRHAESAANVGEITSDFASIPLTARGAEQARALAESWTEAPALIAVSPFTRARDTAQLTWERFPGTPVEDWPVQEFAYLNRDRWDGTSWKQRWQAADEYWQRGDPEYSDGAGAESFSAFLDRVRGALDGLRGQHEPLIFVFTHGQVMLAVRLLLASPDATSAELFSRFLQQAEQHAIANCESFEVILDMSSMELGI